MAAPAKMANNYERVRVWSGLERVIPFSLTEETRQGDVGDDRATRSARPWSKRHATGHFAFAT